jgi:hypothetical protein
MSVRWNWNWSSWYFGLYSSAFHFGPLEVRWG